MLFHQFCRLFSQFVSKEEFLGTRYHGSKGVSVDFMQNLLTFLHCCLCNENKCIIIYLDYKISIASYLQILAIYKIYLDFLLHFLYTFLNLAAAKLFLFQLLLRLLPLAAHFSNLHSQNLNTPVNIKVHATINIQEVNKTIKA